MKQLLLICTAVLMMTTACCKNEAPKEKGALEVIKARTSIRSFTGEKLTEEQIHTMLDAAMAAPTDANVQPWRFIVITDDDIKAGLYQGEKHKHMVTTAGAVIVVCGETTRMVKPHDAEEGVEMVERPNKSWFEDCSAATENLLLAATALDLGAVWLSCYPTERIVERIRAYLDIPANVTPLAIVPVGVPAEQPEPKDKWNPDNIHYDRW